MTPLEKLLAQLEALTTKVDALTAAQATPATPTAPATPSPAAPSAPASGTTNEEILRQLNELRVENLLSANKVPAAYAALLRGRDPAFVQTYLASPEYLNRKGGTAPSTPASSPSDNAGTPPDGANPNPLDKPGATDEQRLASGKFTAEEISSLQSILG